MDWHDERMGRVRVGTAAVVAGGNQALPSAFSLTVDTDYPGDWVCKVVPPMPQGSTGQLNPSGFIVVEEGAVGSRLVRMLPFSQLGIAVQLRGMNLSVRVAATTNGEGLLGCSVSPGVLQTRWNPVAGVLLAATQATDVPLPQLSSLARVAVSGAPATVLTVRQEDSQGNVLASYDLVANEVREIPLAPRCARLGIVNPDAVNAAHATVSALVSE